MSVHIYANSPNKTLLYKKYKKKLLHFIDFNNLYLRLRFTNYCKDKTEWFFIKKFRRHFSI